MQLENSNSYPRGNNGPEMIYLNVERQIKTNMVVIVVFMVIISLMLMWLVRKSPCSLIQTFWIMVSGIICTATVMKYTTDWSVTRVARSVQSVEHRLIQQ